MTPLLCIVVLNSVHANNHTWRDPFVVMPNLRQPGCILYDIKGHTDNRTVPFRDCQDFLFGKDVNFLKSKHLTKLKATSQEFRKKMIQIVDKNLVFFRKNKIIDYSLMLVFR